MKKIIASILIVFPAFAFANFNISAKNGAIVCKGKNLSLTMNASKTAFSTLGLGDDGHPQNYKVTGRNSDGDSFVAFTGNNAEGAKVVLVLADQGAYKQNMSDVFEYIGGASTAMKCK